MRRFFLIAGAMMVLMIIPQTTVWAQDTEFTPAQMEQIRKMFEEWSKQQRQPPAGAASGGRRAPPAKKKSVRADHGRHHKTVNPVRYRNSPVVAACRVDGPSTPDPLSRLRKPSLVVTSTFTLTKCNNGGARDCDKKCRDSTRSASCRSSIPKSRTGSAWLPNSRLNTGGPKATNRDDKRHQDGIRHHGLPVQRCIQPARRHHPGPHGPVQPDPRLAA